ncbi:permease for cytosine/purines, uracil, thiamine, allantoin-domain-containing protein [Aspergillus germanicus]
MDPSKNPSTTVEKSDLESSQPTPRNEVVEDFTPPVSTSSSFGTLLKGLTTAGVEMRGLEPIPPEKRNHTKYYNIFTLFGGSFVSVLPLSIGTTPTLAFGLSFKDAAAMIVTMQFIFVLPTLYILTLAPLLGMRQSVQFRYAFGKYPNAFISLIVILEVLIFGILATVSGAECLSAIRPGTLPVEGSIGIILVVGFAISFIGYRALHLICQYIWIPNSIALLILVGCAGSSLHNQAPARTSGVAAPYLATISICASNMATWGTIVGDYACYMPPHAPRLRLAFYCFMGLYVPFTLMMMLGAAIGGSIGAIPAWGAAYGQGGLGAVLGEILVDKVGGFGRFLLVILGFSIVTTSARDMYSMSLFTVAVVPWLRRVPRVIILFGAAGVMIGVAIAASRSFLSTLSTLVSIAGYMTGPTVCVFLIEWFYFRRADPASMDPKIWNNAAALPSGIPALISSIVPWALIITSMDNAWYVGPIAKHTGDLAYELGTLSAGVLYFPLRLLEVRWRGRL